MRKPVALLPFIAAVETIFFFLLFEFSYVICTDANTITTSTSALFSNALTAPEVDLYLSNYLPSHPPFDCSKKVENPFVRDNKNSHTPRPENAVYGSTSKGSVSSVLHQTNVKLHDSSPLVAKGDSSNQIKNKFAENEAIQRMSYRSNSPFKLLMSLILSYKDTSASLIYECLEKQLPSSHDELKDISPINLGKAFCECTKTVDNLGQCLSLGGLAQGLGCSAKLQCPVKGDDPHIPPTDPTLPALDLKLEEFPSTPAIIPSNIIEKERPIYYWLKKSISLVSRGSNYHLCGEKLPILTIPSWERRLVINAVAESFSVVSPLALVSSKKNSENSHLTDFLISIRGTQTRDEWALNFKMDHGLVDVPHFNHTPIHRGYASLGTGILAPLQLLLHDAASSGTLGRVTITGMSMGAGVAAALGFTVSRSLQEFATVPGFKPSPYKLQLVLFGAPRAGSIEFVQSLSEFANVRTIISTYDPVQYMPCETIPGCPSSVGPIMTAKSLGSRFSYSLTDGVVEIQPSDLPDVWQNPNTIFNIYAWHGCAYDCWLSLNSSIAPVESCYSPNENGVEERAKCRILTPLFPLRK